MGACPSLKSAGTPAPHQLPEGLPGPSDPQPGFEFRGDVVKEGLGLVVVAVGPQVVLLSRGLVTLGHHSQVLLFPFLSFVICTEKRVGAGVSDPKDLAMNLPLHSLLHSLTSLLTWKYSLAFHLTLTI